MLALMQLLAGASLALGQPQSFALAFPQFESRCISVEAFIPQLSLLRTSHPDGRAFLVVQGKQQQFSDMWRGSVGAPLLTVEALTFWMFEGKVVVNEFAHGCMITSTTMPLDAFMEIIRRLSLGERRS